MKGVTTYAGVSKYYFESLLKKIIKLGGLENSRARILDFGCGHGELKRMVPQCDVINYDIISELSDVDDWRSVDFDIFVSNQVFCCFEKVQLSEFLQELKSLKPNVKLVLGISRQGFLNKLGMYLLGRTNAHAMIRLDLATELDILGEYCEIEKVETLLYLADVYVLRFKNIETS